MNQATEEALWRYVEEVLRFSPALDLTAVRDAKVFWRRFIEPSLALLPWLPASGKLMDIGSGMGVPGIPLLLARPALSGALIERRKKRAEFLRHLTRKFALGAEIYDCDIRTLAPLAVDAAVARAVDRPEALLDMCRPHMKPGGVAVFPVSQATGTPSVDGWKLMERAETTAGGHRQPILIYRCSVSRET